MLDELDKELTRRGHRFCRYADDCNIYVRSQRAGERVMASVARFLTTTLRLKVNESKSAVARPEERKFLGFSIANDGSERRIAPQALAKFKARIRDLTSRTRGISLHRMIETLKPYLMGWRGYFGFCQTRACSRTWKRGYVEDCVRICGDSGTTVTNASRSSGRRGLSKDQAAIAAGSPTAYWRMAGHVVVQQALRNHHFDSLGLPRLYTPAAA